VKPFESVTTPASGLVTVTFLAPVAAVAESEMTTARWVAFVQVTELTVIPLPEKAMLAPLTNPLPVIVMAWLDRPWRSELGLSDVTVGRAVTVNALPSDPTPPSRFVTVTVRAPRVAVVETEMLTLRWLESVRLTELTVIPVPEKATDDVGHEPELKFEPVRVTFWLAAPWPRELGLSDTTVGAAFTVNAPASEPTPASRLVTVTLRAPVPVLAGIETFTLRWLESVRVTELTVIPFGENTTDEVGHDPPRKFEPAMTIVWFVAPWPRELGLTDETVGAGLTVNTLLSVPRPPFGLTTVTLRAPVAASGSTEMLTLRCAESVRATELTVIPPPEKRTDDVDQDPARKFEPLTVMVWLVAPRPRELGLSDVTVGAVATVRQPMQVALADPWMIVTFRAVVEALDVTVMAPFRWVESL
jgi:hypothetical protein